MAKEVKWFLVPMKASPVQSVQSVCDLPKSGVSRGPFKLVLFEQMNSEVVAPAETLIAHVAFVASYAIPLFTDNERD